MSFYLLRLQTLALFVGDFSMPQPMRPVVGKVEMEDALELILKGKRRESLSAISGVRLDCKPSTILRYKEIKGENFLLSNLMSPDIGRRFFRFTSAG